MCLRWALASFKPALTAYGLTIADGLAHRAEFFWLTPPWQLLQARLAFANDLTQELARASTAPDGVGFCSLEIAADAWQRVCESLLALHAAISVRLSAVDAACGSPAHASTLAMLSDAHAGKWPCIDADGLLSVPGWAERRVETRRVCDLAVTLTVGDRRLAARLINVSAGGVGLMVAEALPAQAKVSLKLPDGRTFIGHAAWCFGGRAGIMLAARLAETDSLMSAAV